MCNQCKNPDEEHVPAVWTRREALIKGAALVAALQATNRGVLIGRPAHAQAENAYGMAIEWLSYGGDKANSKYSPLAQIDKNNFSRLRVAWTWRSAEEEITKANPDLTTWMWESTPLMLVDRTRRGVSPCAVIGAADVQRCRVVKHGLSGRQSRAFMN